MRKRRKLIPVAGAVFLIAAVTFLILASTAKHRAQSLGCAQQVVAICFAGRLYANDHGGWFPTNFVSMKDEVLTWKILRCAGDGSRKPATSWETFTDENCSYLMVTPGVMNSAKDEVFIRCRVHGHLGYPDNTVFDGKRRRGKYQ